VANRQLAPGLQQPTASPTSHEGFMGNVFLAYSYLPVAAASHVTAGFQATPARHGPTLRSQ